MRLFIGVPMLTVLLAVCSANVAEAGYFGMARWRSCQPCCEQQCHTVMKTCKEIVYEKQQRTCYKTVYDTVYEDKQINCVKNVYETRYRDCVYTVRKPVYETRYRDVCYTVRKPVYETRTCTYPVCNPVWETRPKDVSYTVSKPVRATKTRTYTKSDRHYYYYNDYNDGGPVLDKEQVLDKLGGFVEVDVVLSTGTKVRLKDIESIAKD